MAYALTFYCNSGDGTTLQTEKNPADEIWISIKYPGDESGSAIVLDKSTAIKFAKTIRTEINKIKEGGRDEWI